MNYRNILPLISHTQAFSTDYWDDFGYWNDGTFWYEKTPTYTARVTAYAAATGITDYTILDPLNIFDLGLTYYGLDTIMKALYPMVTDKTSQSDMATQMKYNFMNPLDTNPAFRLNWQGGWVYSRTGALPNGTNAYANTFLTPSSINQNSECLTAYLRLDKAFNLGTADVGYNYIQTFGTTFRSPLNISPTYIEVSSTITSKNGYFIGNRTSSTNIILYKNSTKLNDVTATSGTRDSVPIYIGALNRNTSIAFPAESNEFAFASIGGGLTDFQADIFSTLVNNLQKALNRAVY